MKQAYKDGEEIGVELSDNFDVLSSAVKVHTRDSELNEDTTLANMSVDFSRFSKWTSENVNILGILRSYMMVGKSFVKYSNYIDEWNKEIIIKNPTTKNYIRIKNLIMNNVQTKLILSRSNSGKPLKAFLEYGKEQIVPEEESKQSLKDKLLGKKPKEEDGI